MAFPKYKKGVYTDSGSRATKKRGHRAGKKGRSHGVVEENINMFRRAGYSRHGAVAAAYNVAYPQHRPQFPK